MNESEANARLNQTLNESRHLVTFQERLAYLENNTPCIAETYNNYIEGKLSLQQFYVYAVSDLMAANSPLGKLL